MQHVSSWPVIPTEALWKNLSSQKLQKNPWAAACLPQTTQWNRKNPIQGVLIHVKGERCFTGLPRELVLKSLHCVTTTWSFLWAVLQNWDDRVLHILQGLKATYQWRWWAVASCHHHGQKEHLQFQSLYLWPKSAYEKLWKTTWKLNINEMECTW